MPNIMSADGERSEQAAPGLPSQGRAQSRPDHPHISRIWAVPTHSPIAVARLATTTLCDETAFTGRAPRTEDRGVRRLQALQDRDECPDDGDDRARLPRRNLPSGSDAIVSRGGIVSRVLS